MFYKRDGDDTDEISEDAARAAYRVFDSALRRTPGFNATDKFFEQLGFGDTLKYLVKTVYTIIDENPTALYQWLSWFGSYHTPYKGSAGMALSDLESRLNVLTSDTMRTNVLLFSDFISHVKIIDTVSKFNEYAHLVKHMIRVNSEIIDQIKGKFVPACTITRGQKPMALPAPFLAAAAIPGRCLEFEYSPEWGRDFRSSEDHTPIQSLTDSVNGASIKPDSEYIVFLSLGPAHGIDSLSRKNMYFTVTSFTGFGTSACMYPVRRGIVYDPNDDFGFGSTTLAVEEWKSRLRARIQRMKN